jgi:hypothetical protein
VNERIIFSARRRVAETCGTAPRSATTAASVRVPTVPRELPADQRRLGHVF